MTTHRERKIHCAVCGTPQVVWEIMSYTSFGRSALDLSDQFMYPWAEIKYCTVCGYASPQLDKRPVHPEVIKSEEYRSILRHRWLHEYCKANLCHSLFLVAEGEYAKAAWRTFRAATFCDNLFEQGARDYRLKAVELMGLAHQKSQCVTSNLEHDCLLKVDLLRQSGEFERAKSAIDEGLACNPSELIRLLLEYEQRLIDAADIGSHTIYESGIDKHVLSKKSSDASQTDESTDYDDDQSIYF